ncbi:hypothetical protein LguiA_009174 [Lonicera macranthoides]
MEQELQFKGKVCVTGASGYLSSWLIKRLLLSGYHVTGTVRDPGNEKKVEHLWRLEGAKERLRLVRAELTEEELLKPAIDGTLNVLRSCKKNPSLKRVVLTSSTSAVRGRADFDPNVPLDESSWSSVEFCEKLQIWYAVSKTLAEKAAWDFCKENNIDLVTVIPSFIVGPNLPLDLCSTANDVLGLLKGETEKFYLYGRMEYVHIDDAALCHILVYEHEKAHGRFEVIDRPYFEFNTSKIKNLGFTFKTIEEMFDDCIKSLVEQGHLSSA